MALNETCATFTGYTFTTCDFIVSGVKQVWFSPYSSTTVWATNNTNQITGATIAVPNWKECQIDEALCSFTEEVVGGGQFRSKNIKQTFELVLLGHTQEARNAMNNLINGRWRAAIKLESDEVILFGRSKMLRADAGKSTSGVQAGEETSLRLTFTALGGPSFAPTFDDTFVAANFA